MSFILDALRKSENERQQAAVPGISDVPAVVHRNKIPGWMLGVIAGLTVGVIVLGWAWLTGVGTNNQLPVANTPTQERPLGSVETPVPGNAGTGEVRSLAREARQPGAVENPPGAPIQTPAISAEPASLTLYTGSIATMAELQGSGADLPELNLELHVFSTSPADRFVFINSAKYLEGESLPEGPRLVEITEEGVVLNHRNQSFLLPRE